MQDSGGRDYSERLSAQLDQEFFTVFQDMMTTEFMDLIAGFYEGVQVIAYDRALRAVAKRRGLSPADLVAITEDGSGSPPASSRTGSEDS